MLLELEPDVRVADVLDAELREVEALVLRVVEAVVLRVVEALELRAGLVVVAAPRVVEEPALRVAVTD